MKKHWVVLVAGALLIPAAASARSAHRIQAPPKPTPPRVAPPQAVESPEEDLESFETFEPPWIIEIEGNVGACEDPIPSIDPRRSMVQTWIAWRRQALDALPESLRGKSDHQAAIDDTYRMAIQGFLTAEEAAIFEPAEVDVSIINRPPVGGYDIGGVGFTDIDEQSGESLRSGGLAAAAEDPTSNLEYLRARERTRLEWMRWMRDAIEALPESLRKDSDYLRAIQDMYRSGIGDEEIASVVELSIDLINRPVIQVEVAQIGNLQFQLLSDNTVLTEHFVESK